MTKVIKKGGRKEAFVGAKLKRSIQKSAKEAGLTASEAKALVSEVAGPIITKVRKRKFIKASELRRAVLGKLDKSAKKVAKAWRKYDLHRKKK